ncbi:hypothetical protein HYU82_02425 [Candidatus Saccharibacteria bacterium]|nr:hypothetical protein [Candidatus Saccharibacteria bacterium]
MPKERGYRSFIDEAGFLDRLPREQGTFDELLVELDQESRYTEDIDIRQTIGSVALVERQTDQPNS